MNKNEIKISERVLLSLEEAAAYSGLGINKLRQISSEPGCKFVVFNGSKRLFKRKLLEEYLLSIDYSI